MRTRQGAGNGGFFWAVRSVLYYKQNLRSVLRQGNMEHEEKPLENYRAAYHAGMLIIRRANHGSIAR